MNSTLALLYVRGCRSTRSIRVGPWIHQRGFDMHVVLSNEQADLIIYALSLRRNYIETGDCILSASDVQTHGGGAVKALHTDQMRLILKQEQIITYLQSAKD
jgi:hypothetical protein